MPNFWNNLNLNTNKNNKGFSIQDFLKFANESKGKDPNQMLQQMINSGQVTQEQLENAKGQAQGIYQMLKSIGIKI